MSDHSTCYEDIKCAYCGERNSPHFGEYEDHVFDCLRCGKHNRVTYVGIKALRPSGWVCEIGKKGYRLMEYSEAEADIAEGKALIAKGQRVLQGGERSDDEGSEGIRTKAD
tara:strand:+ start:827 stop:1159 length:333 start_codon:yes stop_codon:yes gene_type:complete